MKHIEVIKLLAYNYELISFSGLGGPSGLTVGDIVCCVICIDL